ncbi:MAG: cbb3-type cytochrome c oxidase subunit 3 [Pseudomonadota bacterium]|jgi:cytochrome c oxidase cbb3-type subunit 4
MTYEAFREFADSWALLALVAIFIGTILWAFRPGSRPAHEDSASIPFRNEDRPAPQPEPESAPRARETRT